MKTITHKVYSSKWVAAVCLKVGERFSFSNDETIYEVTEIERKPNEHGEPGILKIAYYELGWPELGTEKLWPTNIVRPIKTMLMAT